ncbi:beta-3-deoxy-D-manno-oct-2-ulosonic acid transferase [uncultured Cohaesibacter sp.]|uniref:capsular polysaccharide export protein, LipB/KpsS family n=1 Tax=uncultured Cohaesibacter sp. TaxID=1002546 RepID=UPI0029C8D00A|nr:beta-3-deoxy-D-manno-oct-2-ulosonic acid transferase [uncultured Cohaesibacter sp.]
MNEDQPFWKSRPAVIYGVGFWNRKSVRGMLARLPERPRFFWSFESAVSAAQRNGACLFAWTTRLHPEQRDRCETLGIPVVNVEDGFIRSVGLGAAFVPASSLIMDGRGIYYDASRPSDLEWMLEHDEVGADERFRGAALREVLIARGVSKYNVGDDGQSRVSFPAEGHRILVPGQVSDDASIKTSHSETLDLQSGENPNLQLLRKARERNPDAFILFKPHPDVTSGLRNGAVSQKDMLHYADAVETDVDIIRLINQCDSVETICSLAGFEALLRGKTVVAHGQPFYAGWGLTLDQTPIERRTRKRTLEELVYLTLIRYPNYVSPVSFLRCSAEEVVSALAERRQSKANPVVSAVSLMIAKAAFRLGL